MQLFLLYHLLAMCVCVHLFMLMRVSLPCRLCNVMSTEHVKQISATIDAAKAATNKEERDEHNQQLKEHFKKMLYRVQMQGEISTELGLRINATQRELGQERGHWESGTRVCVCVCVCVCVFHGGAVSRLSW